MESTSGVRQISVFDKLPDHILEKTIGFSKDVKDEEISYIQSRLPSSDHNEITKLINRNFPISKKRHVPKKRIRNKGGQWLGGRLSSTRKRELGLYRMSRSGLKFADVLPVHAMWVQYMQRYLRIERLTKKNWHSIVDSDEFKQQLWKADYHGAYISVVKSLCPSLVGYEGILVMETRNTFKIVSNDDVTRTISKETCEFQLKIGELMLKFLGKNFVTRPAERAKKFRSSVFTEL